MIKAEWDLYSLWVVTETAELYCGDDVVLKVVAQDTELRVEFEDGWAQYFTDNDAWTEALDNLKKKLQKTATPKKGLGKGKGRNKGRGASQKGSV